MRDATQPWYREPWPWILMAGPAIVVVAGFATLAIAVKTDDGLVADDYYKQGLAINRVLRARRAGARARPRGDGAVQRRARSRARDIPRPPAAASAAPAAGERDARGRGPHGRARRGGARRLREARCASRPRACGACSSRTPKPPGGSPATGANRSPALRWAPCRPRRNREAPCDVDPVARVRDGRPRGRHHLHAGGSRRLAVIRGARLPRAAWASTRSGFLFFWAVGSGCSALTCFLQRFALRAEPLSAAVGRSARRLPRARSGQAAPRARARQGRYPSRCSSRATRRPDGASEARVDKVGGQLLESPARGQLSGALFAVNPKFANVRSVPW